MSRLFNNALYYSTANIVNAIVPFLLLPILTRVLSPESYGVIAMFAAVVTVLGAFTGLNVHGSITVKYFDRGSSRFSHYIGSCLVILLASTMLVLCVVYLLRSPISHFTAVPESWLLGAVLVAAFNALIQIRLTLWMAQERAIAYGLLQFGRTVLDLGLSIFLVVVLLQDFEGRLWARTLATFVFSALVLIILFRSGIRIYRPKMEHVHEAVRFGAPLIPHVVGVLLISQADRFVISSAIGVAEAGIYMVAVQIGLGMAVITDAFNRAFVPWLYQRLSEGNQRELQQVVRGTWVYFAIILGVAGIVALLANLIVGIFAGAGFAGAAAPLAWIALGQAFQGMYLMVTNYIFFTRKTALLSGVTLFVGIAGLGLTILLVTSRGIVGAGMAFAAIMLLKFALTWVLAQRSYPMPWLSALRSNRRGAAG